MKKKDLLDGMSESDKAAVEEYLRRREDMWDKRSEASRQRAKEYDQRRKEREAQRPKAVKEFFDSAKVFRKVMELAINAAEKGQFAPESFPLVANRRAAIEELLKRLTNAINGGAE